MVWSAGCGQAVEVKIARPERVPVELSFTSSGYVKGREVQVQSTMPLKVTRVLVSEGDPVQVGATLAEMDDAALRQRLASAQTRRASAKVAVSRALQAATAARAQIERGIAQASAQVEGAKARYRVVQAGARRPAIAQAEHRVRQAEAALQEANNAYQRAQRLHEEGALSAADRDRAQEARKIAEAELGIAREGLRLLRQGATPDELAVARADIASAEAALRQAESRRTEFAVHDAEVQIARAAISEAEALIQEAQTALKDTRILAPISGIVAKVDLEPGELLQPGMLTLMDAKGLYVEAELGESDLGAIFTGQAVEVRSASFSGTVFPGKVVQIGASAEPKPDMSLRTRIVRVRIAFEDPERRLKPGMEVDVEGSRKLKEAITIPESALVSDGNLEKVFTLKNGTAQAISVTSGERFSGKVAILKGLTGNETLILDPPLDLKPGTAVREVK